MTYCTQFDALAEAAALGGPRETRALDAHVSTCAACAAEAVLADDASDLVDVLAPLRAGVCPPAVVTAALRDARRTARPPVRAARRFARLRVATLAFGVTLVVGLALRVSLAGSDDVALGVTDAPALEVATTETGEPLVGLTTPATDTPSADATDKPDEPVKADPAPTAPAPERAAAEPSPRLRPTLTSATVPPPDPAPTASDTLAAVHGLRLALAVVRDARQEGLAAVAPELGRPQVALASTISDVP